MLAIGVSDYGEAARHLDLAYADHDARDVAAALRNSQSSLYAQVLVSELVNARGDQGGDPRASSPPCATRWRRGSGGDLAVSSSPATAR